AGAAIAGVCALHGIRGTSDQRMRWALALGSDVPFAQRGGTQLGMGRGEILTKIRLARSFRALVAVPRWRISTAIAYGSIDLRKKFLTLWKSKLRSAQLLGREQLRAESWLRLGNTFEEVLGSRRA